jgi:ATP-dependent Clp protease ATP-binding subunit ClpA
VGGRGSRRPVSYGCVVLENFSVRAKHVVSLAMIEAQGLDHSRVGTEHLLLGLLADGDGAAARVLREAGASLAAARHTVAEVVGADVESPDGEVLPLTARAQRALGRAGRFSRQEREHEVTAAHVLLGVLDVEGLACQVLRGLGVDIASLRNAVVASGADVGEVIVTDAAVMRPRCPQCRAALDDTVAEALIATRQDGRATSRVSVVYCTGCGTTLGVLRPESA